MIATISAGLVTFSMFTCAQHVVRPDSKPTQPAPRQAAQSEDGGTAVFEPKAGQHGILVRCGGPARTPDNPLGVSRSMLRDPDAFFRQQQQRALQLHEITGNARIVFHMINGWDHEGMSHSAAVLDAMPTRRRQAFELMVRNLNEAGVTVGVYFSSKVPRVSNSVYVRDAGPVESFDYENPRHREVYIEGIIDPLIELGVKEIWLDHSSPLEHRGEFVKLAEELRGKGAYLVMEATPRVQQPLGMIDHETVSKVASASLDRFIYNSNDIRDNQWLPLPNDTEIIAIISGHQTRDDTVPSDPDEKRAYLAERMALRLQQGFTVFNMEGSMDEEFLALVQQWVDAEGQQIDSMVASQHGAKSATRRGKRLRKSQSNDRDRSPVAIRTTNAGSVGDKSKSAGAHMGTSSPSADPVIRVIEPDEGVRGTVATIYDALWFWGQHPVAVNSGSTWMPMAHYAFCRGAGNSSDGSHWLTPATVETVHAWLERTEGIDATWTGKIVLDAEPYTKVPFNREAFRLFYLETLEAWRTVLPHAEFAFFGPPSILITDPETGQKRYPTTEEYGWLYEAVDFIAPQVYPGLPNWTAGQENVARNRMGLAIQAAVSAGHKPVYPVIRARTSPGLEWVTNAALTQRTNVLVEMGAQGIILWDAPPKLGDSYDFQAHATEFRNALELMVAATEDSHSEE